MEISSLYRASDFEGQLSNARKRLGLLSSSQIFKESQNYNKELRDKQIYLNYFSEVLVTLGPPPWILMEDKKETQRFSFSSMIKLSLRSSADEDQ